MTRTQGRLLCWSPSGEAGQKRQKISAAHPDLSCRFVKEGSLSKSEFLADIDFLDFTARGETLNAPGQPVLLQCGFGPAYGLIIVNCTHVHTAVQRSPRIAGTQWKSD